MPKKPAFIIYAEHEAERMNNAREKVKNSDLDDETKETLTYLCTREIHSLWDMAKYYYYSKKG